MPKHLAARPPLDTLEERHVRKLTHSTHAPADWIVHAKIVARSWDGLRTRQIAADETIEEVVVATSMLAQQKIGAIIVLEREIGLRNYIESGIPLDATLTYDLLATIFRPGSPLHDGAVILQEGRVAAAACFLPLTVNPRLSRELGTRHRAAIGLTEESDAAAIVVSEESGLISVALDGEIERALSPDELRHRLRDLIQPRRRFRKRDADR